MIPCRTNCLEAAQSFCDCCIFLAKGLGVKRGLLMGLLLDRSLTNQPKGIIVTRYPCHHEIRLQSGRRQHQEISRMLQEPGAMQSQACRSRLLAVGRGNRYFRGNGPSNLVSDDGIPGQISLDGACVCVAQPHATRNKRR